MQAVETNEPIVSIDTQFNYQGAIAQYEQIVAQGGWEPMPKNALNLILGNSRNSVVSIKRRLMVSGDLAPREKIDDLFDQDLDAAVRLFQARHGLLITGKVDEPTLYAMAVPADYRLTQLRLNALPRREPRAQARVRPLRAGQHPGREHRGGRGRQVVQRHTAVVGKVERATPIINSKILPGEVQSLLDGAQEHHREGHRSST